MKKDEEKLVIYGLGALVVAFVLYLAYSFFKSSEQGLANTANNIGSIPGDLANLVQQDLTNFESGASSTANNLGAVPGNIASTVHNDLASILSGFSSTANNIGAVPGNVVKNAESMLTQIVPRFW